MVRVLVVAVSLVVLVLGLAQVLFWRLVTAEVEDGKADLVLVGSIMRVGMTEAGDRVDAVEETFDRWHFVRFEVRKVVRGSWDQPDLGVAVHSPSGSFRATAKSVGERHVLTFERRKLESGRTVLVYQGSARCSWLFPPCVGS